MLDTTQPDLQPTARFSSRVLDYIRFRPSYPQAVIDVLRDHTDFNSQAVVADIGSGTGISAELFLGCGNTVYGVEPNPQMRAAAEALLSAYGGFHSIAGTAEQTNLPEAAIDFVVSCQAFHWFDRERARAEFKRVARPNAWLVVMWNERKLDATPFLSDYENLLQSFGTDYGAVKDRYPDADQMKTCFSEQFRRFALPNEQSFDFAGLKGRLLSSSYVPAQDDPRAGTMLDELAEIFNAHQQDGRVTILYDTLLYFGRL
jgi:SAM-dependent methyltransferase